MVLTLIYFANFNIVIFYRLDNQDNHFIMYIFYILDNLEAHINLVTSLKFKNYKIDFNVVTFLYQKIVILVPMWFSYINMRNKITISI